MPELTLRTALTEWTFDPAVALLAAVLAAWYVLAMRRHGGAWPRARAAGFLGLGLGSLLLVTMSFVGAYADTLFWVRALQVIVLLTITPLFLANGAPLTLLGREFTGRVARLLTFPPVGTALLVLTPWVLYFTPLYEAVLRGFWVDEAVKVAIVGIGFLYFWARLQVDPMPRQYPHLVSMGITFGEAVFDGALGLTLIFMTHPVGAAYYDSLHRTWGPSDRLDHVIGGGILWMVGDLAGLPFLAVLFVRMFRQDRTEAARIDAELDVQAAAERAAAGLPDDPAEPEMTRPWWETDPVLSKRYGRGSAQ